MDIMNDHFSKMADIDTSVVLYQLGFPMVILGIFGFIAAYIARKKRLPYWVTLLPAGALTLVVMALDSYFDYGQFLIPYVIKPLEPILGIISGLLVASLFALPFAAPVLVLLEKSRN
jgi:uncharacterized membrane protein HdeD (DUF308 family)